MTPVPAPDGAHERHEGLPTPDELGERGAALWRSIADGWALRADEARFLLDACSLTDTIARLEVELAGSPLVVKGSMGQPVTNSLVTEIRHHRTAVGTLLARIDLEDDDEPSSGRSTRSEVGRKLARVRWDPKVSADGA